MFWNFSWYTYQFSFPLSKLKEHRNYACKESIMLKCTYHEDWFDRVWWYDGPKAERQDEGVHVGIPWWQWHAGPAHERIRRISTNRTRGLFVVVLLLATSKVISGQILTCHSHTHGDFIVLDHWNTRPLELWAAIPLSHIILTLSQPVLALS